jgi:hypothetical protein
MTIKNKTLKGSKSNPTLIQYRWQIWLYVGFTTVLCNAILRIRNNIIRNCTNFVIKKSDPVSEPDPYIVCVMKRKNPDRYKIIRFRQETEKQIKTNQIRRASILFSLAQNNTGPAPLIKRRFRI